MNYTRSDQISIIKAISLKEGDNKTLDCPFCGGRKKFTITKRDGVTFWNCYKASCTARGGYKSGRSLDAIKNKVNGNPVPIQSKTNPIPSILSNVDNHPVAIDYLNSVNSYDSFKNGLIEIKYHPAHNRVLYFTPDKTGAVGRALDKRLPKWMTYGDTTSGIQVGNTNHAIVVEDVASACSVARITGLTGYALLGTNITPPIKRCLRQFSKCTIVLDMDASSKALTLSKRMPTVVNTSVRLTREDLKLLNEDQIRNILR